MNLYEVELITEDDNEIIQVNANSEEEAIKIAEKQTRLTNILGVYANEILSSE